MEQVLTQEQVTQRFETGISENNLKHWGELEVLKEFVQNMVFAKTVLGDNTMICHENGFAIISNCPSGFNKGKLLIGESEQAGVVGAPGEYGEGSKVAMAVACRLGLKCHIQTNGFLIEPKLEPSSLDPEVKTLVFYISDTPDWNKGTVVSVQCDKKTLGEAQRYFAVLGGISEEKTKTNSVIDSVKNTIYVNGVKITEVNSIQSYNFTNTELMNRDRTSIDMGKVKTEVRHQLAKTEEVDRAAVILQQILQDDSLLEAQSGVEEWECKASVWKGAIKLLFGDKVAMGVGGSSDTVARYHKFTVLTNVPSRWQWFFKTYLNIHPTSELDEVAIKPTRVVSKPKGDESANLGWCKRLIKLYYADYGTVKVSEKVVDEFGNECDGCYDCKSDITWIKKSILQSKEETFKTLLHETVHRETGASDNTPEFTKGWEQACWGILNRGR